ncbi:hypothetical protein VI817_007319 [Penicillium citrinum]|nr:hypothetical protein VI817_007319 [Penicillium citrinum]
METFQELADIPKDFVREGSLFIKRCTKPDKREFIKISQAVGMGFLVMGAIGYFVKLSPGRWRINASHSYIDELEAGIGAIGDTSMKKVHILAQFELRLLDYTSVRA